MKNKYKYALESDEISEEKSKSIWEYLGIVAEGIGLIIREKEKICPAKNSASQTPQEQSPG
jgi:hypothetical protein